MVDIQAEIITGKTFRAQIIEGDIYHLHFLANMNSTGEDYKGGHEAYNELRNGIPLRIIVENGKYATMDSSAREYLQNNKFDAVASAIVLSSISQRIVYNFYIKFRNQNYPTKAFSSKELALKWLRIQRL